MNLCQLLARHPEIDVDTDEEGVRGGGVVRGRKETVSAHVLHASKLFSSTAVHLHINTKPRLHIGANGR